MKKFLLSFSMLLLLNQVEAQCTLEPFSIQKRVYASDVVIEGRVLTSESYWNSTHSFIYTVNQVEVGKIFEGANQLSGKITLSLITEGGLVDLDALKVEPSLQVQPKEVGIFFLKRTTKELDGSGDVLFYEGVASEQSFVKYDELTGIAHGYFERYTAIEAELHPKIMEYTGKDVKKISDLGLSSDKIKSLASPVINSLSLDTLSSGTGTILTITGSNFGIIRDQGTVEFLDPNFGDGRYFDPNYPSSYKSWSSSKIEVYVPSRSGSGKIRVTNNNGEWSLSSAEIYVKYAHSNVGYGGTTGIDSGFFQVDHIDDNSNGGYTWSLNRKFALNSNAVNSFLRAAENWRCETLMNWDVGDNTNTDAIARDNENVVRFTKFTDSRLGVCYSWYSGCFNSGGVYWYVNEMDVDFDSTRNWYYGTNKPGKSQFDFETVATHELGHGHQLSHVIDDTKIMHYSLSGGDRNVSLSDNDIEGGEFVIDKSKTANPCGPDKFVPIQRADCNLTQPEGNFVLSDTISCPNINVTITDASKGKVKTYSWNFGEDANPASSNMLGPHTIQYTSSGLKTIQLVVTNDFGSDTSEAMVRIQPDTPDTPTSFAFTDTACVGSSSYLINTVENALSYNWSLSDGGSIVGDNSDTTVIINWTTPGLDYTLSVSASNNCGVSTPVSNMIDVMNVAVADFDNTDASLTIDFTNFSTSGQTYLWDFGDGNTSIEKDITHKFSTKGVYTVSLKTSNVCSDSTLKKDITVNYGVGILEAEGNRFGLYPNPAENYVRIKYSGANATLFVYDNTGRLVIQEQLISGINRIDLSDFLQGNYLWEVKAESEINQGKLLIIR